MKNGRCRIHGGLSTGARTKEGKDRQRRAATKSGLYAGPNNPVVLERFGTGQAGPNWPGRRAGTDTFAAPQEG